MANIVIRPYQLNVAPGGVETVVNLSQYENGRELVFHLVGEGQIVIPAGSTAIIAGTKPDDTIYSAVGYVDADENTVTFQENVQMSAAAGKWYAKVKVTASGQTVASGMVKFVVEKDVIPPDAEQSSSDIQGLIAEAAQYAEDARNSFANDARTMEFHELTTTDQTIIDALNELDGDTNALDSSVNALEALTFPNLPSLTSTSDTDLIHVNSGGTDYKQEKINFLKGDFQHSFDNSSTLTSQIDALSTGTYFGGIGGYGKQTETGLPINANCYVKAQKYASTFCVAEIWSINNTEGQHWIATKVNGTWGSWEHVPSRSEITSLNSSLTKSSVSISPSTSSVTINANSSFVMNNVVFINLRITISTAMAAGTGIVTAPIPKTTLTGGTGVVSLATNNTSVSVALVANGTIAASSTIAAGTYVISGAYEKA